MKSDSSSEINANESSSEVNEQVANQTNEQGDNNILTAENGNATANPIELDISVLSELSQQIETLKSQIRTYLGHNSLNALPRKKKKLTYR